MPEISVIVPFHNEEATIGKCIEAIRSQSLPDERYELILVDNNSTDESVSVVQRFRNLTLLRETEPGSYAARNLGLGVASGDIIAFTDADCVPGKNWLMTISQVMENQQIGILVGAHDYAGDTFWLSAFAAFQETRNHFIFSHDIPALYFGHTNNMAVRKEFFDEFGPFITRMRGSDAAFVRKVVNQRSCAVAVFDTDVRVRHLEITGVLDIFKKSFIYARSRRITHRENTRRSLNRQEQIRVFRRTIALHDFNWLQSLGLLLLLVADKIPWVLGSLAGVLHKERR